MGKPSQIWCRYARLRRGKPAIQVRFRRSACAVCTARPHCNRSESGPRTQPIFPSCSRRLFQSARQRQARDDFKAQYALSSRIECTIALATDKLRMQHKQIWSLVTLSSPQSDIAHRCQMLRQTAPCGIACRVHRVLWFATNQEKANPMTSFFSAPYATRNSCCYPRYHSQHNSALNTD